MSSSLPYALLALVSVIAFLGFFLAATPFLQRKGEVFAVTLPREALDDVRVSVMKKRYVLVVALLAIALSLICLALIPSGDQAMFFAVYTISVVAELAISYGLMLFYRQKVIALKQERSWSVEVSRAAAVVGEEGDVVPKAVSLWWNLLYLPIIAVTFAIIALSYDAIPDMVPMHIGFDGEVNGWMQKGIGVFAFPLGIEIFLAAVMTLSHYMMTVSKKWTDPGAPATSAWAYGCYLRANTAFIVIAGLLLCAVIGVGMALAIVDAVGLGVMVAAIIFVTLFICVGSAALSIYYGQAGSRLVTRVENISGASEDDACWKLGAFYWNPDDASAVIPKRFGFGWTINWARPVVWAWVVGFVVLNVAFVVFCFTLV